MANVLNYILTFDATQAKAALVSFQSYLSSVASSIPSVGNPFTNLVSGAASAQSAIGNLGGALVSMQTLAAGAAAAFAKSSIDAASQAEAAFKGLESVSNRTGVGIEKSWKAVQDLTADGVLSQTQAATALKNLFARGFNLEQSIKLINAFKDSAAFGRQATLSWADAVVTATEGLKNENSMLVDNAGVTKNVAKMWEEYANKHNLVAASMTIGQKRTAEYEGVLRETALQAGDTGKALDGVQGANAKLEKSFGSLKTALGDQLTPAWQGLITLLDPVLEKIKQFIELMGAAEKLVNPFRTMADGETARQRARPGQGSELFKAIYNDRMGEASNEFFTKANVLLGIDPIGMPALDGKAGANGVPDSSTNTTGIRVQAQPGMLHGPTTSTASVVDNVIKSLVAIKAEKEAAFDAIKADSDKMLKDIEDAVKAGNVGTDIIASRRLKESTDRNDKEYAALQKQVAALAVEANTADKSNNAEWKTLANKGLADAKIELEAAAKARYEKGVKQLTQSKQSAADDLTVYKAGLDAQRAALDLHSAKTKENYAATSQALAELDIRELTRVEAERKKQEVLLRTQVDSANSTNNVETATEARLALESNLKQGIENQEKLKTAQTKAQKDVLDATRQDTAQVRQIQETLLNARLAAEKTASDAILERNLANNQALYDEKKISEIEFLNTAKRLRDASFVKDLARIKEQQDVLANQKSDDPVKKAEDKAKADQLGAQYNQILEQRTKNAEEAESKKRLSAQETARLQLDLDRQILEAEGKTFKAREQAIDNWLEEQRKTFAKYPDLLERSERVAAGQKKQNKFAEGQDGVTVTNMKFDKEQADLQRLSQKGLLTDIELDQKSLALKKEQVAALRLRLDLLKQNADSSTGSAQAIADLEKQIADLDGSFSTIAQSINDNFFSAIESGFQQLLSGAKSLSEVLRGVFIQVLQQLANIALKSSMQSMFGSAGSSGGGLGGAFMSLFGGAREAGGPVEGGKVYLVGEKGPELWRAPGAGSIMNNAALTSALTGSAARPAMSAGRDYQPAAQSGGDTNVHVAPKVVVSSSHIIEALRQDPEFERMHVRMTVANGKKIQGSW